MQRILISDLHLDDSTPILVDAFFAFMDRVATRANQLFILGDFFEVWIGDDDDAELPQKIAARLADYVDAGGELYLMVGNRDFLMGEAYAKRCKATLLADPTTHYFGATPTLLMHGDSLCTADTAYMEFRQISRSAQWQQQMLAQPLDARRQFARQARAQSRSHNAMQTEAITDVTADEVTKLMSEQGVTRLIHGHTHRPAVHTFELNGAPAQRWVLGDWGDSVWWIECQDDEEPQLKQLATSELLRDQNTH